MFIDFQLPNLPEIITVCLSSLLFLGHNLWLVGKNEQTGVRIEANTGDHFPESDSAVKPARIADFRIILPTETVPITNYRIEDHSLVTEVQPSEKATSFCVALALHAHPITLEARKFAGYIKEENAEERVKANFVAEQTTEPQRESYSKFAKVLIEATEGRENNISNIVAGHRLEIVPQISPSRIESNQMLPVQVLLEGKPIAGLRISSGCEELNDGKYLSDTLTDKDGMADVQISKTGHWFARTHFIRPHFDKENFEWESFWASVTFRT